MAEGLLRAKAGDRFEAFSAGVEPRPVNSEAVQVMTKAGSDISGQRSKDACQYLGHVHFGYLITVCDRASANCPIFPGVSQRLHWSLDDPAAVERRGGAARNIQARARRALGADRRIHGDTLTPPDDRSAGIQREDGV